MFGNGLDYRSPQRIAEQPQYETYPEVKQNGRFALFFMLRATRRRKVKKSRSSNRRQGASAVQRAYTSSYASYSIW